MKLLELEHFLKLFKRKSQTLQEFIEKAKVKVGKNLTPLSQYMKDKNIDRKDIKMLYENIENRNEYLTRFYNVSLKVDFAKVHIDQPPMKSNHMNNNEEIKYKNIIRNIYYEDILQNTKSGIENVTTYLDLLTDLFTKNIIDYKILTPSAIHYMNEGRIGSVYSSYYFRASIMNPFLVYSLNHSLLKGTKIFTPTLGWTSYCYGFLECPLVKEYVGTDVIPSVCKTTNEFAKIHSPSKIVDIYCQPSENLFHNASFLSKYKQHFDLVFFSPPYYKLELYKSDNQSTDRYKTYEEWLEKYWNQTIQLCHHVLQKNGKLCYILSGYGSQNTKEQYDLLTDMNNITKKYFKLKNTQPMYNKDVHVTKHKETNEKIMIFVK